LALLLASPAFAEDVRPGFDFWQTVGSGATSYSFADDPLPADFFCSGSRPFKGEVNFEGVPLKSDPSRALGTSDTIVERLDAVKFDGKGEGSTRIKVRALHLESRDPLTTTKCGDWDVEATLASGFQPTTTMTLQQNQLCPGNIGTFSADLVLNVDLVFTSTSTSASASATRTVSLPLFDSSPYVIGTAGTQCNATLPANQSVQVLQGDFTVSSNDTFTGNCYCECGNPTNCQPLTEEHLGPHESHFVMPPCEFFGYPCSDDPVIVAHIQDMMQAFADSGAIDEDAETATDKIVNKQY
jgi:hypothetical protein